jgi:hypothetical protein
VDGSGVGGVGGVGVGGVGRASVCAECILRDVAPQAVVLREKQLSYRPYGDCAPYDVPGQARDPIVDAWDQESQWSIFLASALRDRLLPEVSDKLKNLIECGARTAVNECFLFPGLLTERNNQRMAERGVWNPKHELFAGCIKGNCQKLNCYGADGHENCEFFWDLGFSVYLVMLRHMIVLAEEYKVSQLSVEWENVAGHGEKNKERQDAILAWVKGLLKDADMGIVGENVTFINAGKNLQEICSMGKKDPFEDSLQLVLQLDMSQFREDTVLQFEFEYFHGHEYIRFDVHVIEKASKKALVNPVVCKAFSGINMRQFFPASEWEDRVGIARKMKQMQDMQETQKKQTGLMRELIKEKNDECMLLEEKVADLSSKLKVVKEKLNLETVRNNQLADAISNIKRQRCL